MANLERRELHTWQRDIKIAVKTKFEKINTSLVLIYHLCTVSIRLATQSSWNSTHARLRDATVTRPKSTVQYLLYSEHIIKSSIHTHTQCGEKRTCKIKLLREELFWQAGSSTTCSRAKDSCAVSTWCLPKQILLAEMSIPAQGNYGLEPVKNVTVSNYYDFLKTGREFTFKIPAK